MLPPNGKSSPRGRAASAIKSWRSPASLAVVTYIHRIGFAVGGAGDRRKPRARASRRSAT